MKIPSRIIFALAMAAAVLGLLLLAGCTQSGPGGTTNATANITHTVSADANADGFSLIAKSFDHLAQLGDYSLTVNDSNGAYDTFETIERLGALQHVQLKTPVDTKNVYWTGNETIYCITTPEKPQDLCFQVTNNSFFYPETAGYKTMIFDSNYIDGSRQENQLFQASYARTFIANVTNETYNGFPCRQTEFTTDYKKMTVDQLNQLGLTSDTYQFNDNFDTKMCIADNGVPIYLDMSYLEVYDNLTRRTVRTVTDFKTGGFNITVPQVNSNESAFGAEYNDALAALKAYASCFKVQNESDRNDCYKGSAFQSKDAKICQKISDVQKHDQCIIAIMSDTVEPQLCNSTTVFADDCYADAARVTNDSSYCLQVKNESVQKLCLDYLNGTIKPQPECTSDADCMPTGCSATVCAPKDSPVTTTCEWLPQYDCYKQSFASCGCNAGICGWKQNASLTACIAQAANETANQTVSGNQSTGGNQSSG